MEAAQILSADVLDIIFDERNKEYGAYDLRKHYQRRLMKAFLMILLLVVLLCLAYILFGSMKPGTAKLLAGPDVILTVAPPLEPKTIIPPPPPPPPKMPPPVKMLDFTSPPIIEKNPPKEEMPPPQTDLEKAVIGTANVEGEDDKNITAPVDDRKGIVEAPKKQEEGETTFTKVEIEAQYPGGAGMWSQFLYRNLQYPQEAVDQNIQGTVMIEFIVDVQGNVSSIRAISGPEELRRAAEAVFIKCSKWIPGIQNGHPVKSYKRQPITFKLAEG